MSRDQRNNAIWRPLITATSLDDVEDDLLCEMLGGDLNLEIEQRDDVLREAFMSLPEEHRAILRFSILEGMSHRQIALHLGRKAGWVAVAAHAARFRLRASLSHNSHFVNQS